MMYVNNSKTNGPSKVTIIVLEKNILQHQQFIESVAELSESIRIPLSMMFAVSIRMCLFRAQVRRVNDLEKRQSHWLER